MTTQGRTTALVVLGFCAIASLSVVTSIDSSNHDREPVRAGSDVSAAPQSEEQPNSASPDVARRDMLTPMQRAADLVYRLRSACSETTRDDLLRDDILRETGWDGRGKRSSKYPDEVLIAARRLLCPAWADPVESQPFILSRETLRPRLVRERASGIPLVLIENENIVVYLGQTELTVRQWDYLFMRPGTRDPNYWRDASQAEFPVREITIGQIRYALKLARTMLDTKLRIPTHQEWVAAARGLPMDVFSNKRRRAQYISTSDQGTSMGMSVPPVAQTRPSLDGAYDMLGNVWEWVHYGAGEDGTYAIVGGGFAGKSFPDDFPIDDVAFHPDGDPRPDLGVRLARDPD